MQAVSTTDVLMACASPFSFTPSLPGWRLSRPGRLTLVLKHVGWLVVGMAILTAVDFQIFMSILPQPAPSREKTLSWCYRRPGENLIHDFSYVFSRMFESFPLVLIPMFSLLIIFVPERCHFCLPSWPTVFSWGQASMKQLSHSLKSFQEFVLFLFHEKHSCWKHVSWWLSGSWWKVMTRCTQASWCVAWCPTWMTCPASTSSHSRWPSGQLWWISTALTAWQKRTSFVRPGEYTLKSWDRATGASVARGLMGETGGTSPSNHFLELQFSSSFLFLTD